MTCKFRLCDPNQVAREKKHTIAKKNTENAPTYATTANNGLKLQPFQLLYMYVYMYNVQKPRNYNYAQIRIVSTQLVSKKQLFIVL